MIDRSKAGHYRVYVVELADEACTRRSTKYACVYVGETWKSPDERFAEHKAGLTASKIVRDHGKRLRPDLYRRWGPYATREDASAAEQRLATRLAERGFTVVNRPGPMKWRGQQTV
jgi:hypothetical protein